MDRNRAFELLGLTPGSDIADIFEAFYKRRERLQNRLESATTPEDQARYEKALRVLEAARVEASRVPDTKPSPPRTGAETIVVPTPPPNSARRTGFTGGQRSMESGSRPTYVSGGVAPSGSGFSMRANDLIADRYEVRGLLGQGGMGQVFRAYDRKLGHDIAMKVLHPALVNNEQARERFEREATISLELSHPNIVRVHGVHRDSYQHFITMELLEGHTLRDEMELHLARGKQAFPVAKAVAIVLAISRALEFAHRLTIHRDIKPENIFLCHDGTVKLMDFGIAGVLAPSALTMTGAAMGTAYYMPPEQLAGDRSIDHRADQYSLAVVLYEMLSGRIPQGKVTPLRSQRKEVSSPISQAVDRALSPQADGRFKSMAAFAAELRLKPSWHERGLVRAALIFFLFLGLGSLAWGNWKSEIASTWSRMTVDEELVTAAKRANQDLDLELVKLRGLEPFLDLRLERELKETRLLADEALNAFAPEEALEHLDRASELLAKLGSGARQRERDHARLSEKQKTIQSLRGEIDGLSASALAKQRKLETWLGSDKAQDPQGYRVLEEELDQLRGARQYLENKLALEEAQVLLAQASNDENELRRALENLAGLDERLASLRSTSAFERIGELSAGIDRRLDAMLAVEEPLARQRIEARRARAEQTLARSREELVALDELRQDIGGRPAMKPKVLKAERGLPVREVERSHVEHLLWRVQTISSNVQEKRAANEVALRPRELQDQADQAFEEADYLASSEFGEAAGRAAVLERAQLQAEVLRAAAQELERPLSVEEEQALRLLEPESLDIFAARRAASATEGALTSWKTRTAEQETAHQESLRCSSCKGCQECLHCERRGRIEKDCPTCENGNITTSCGECAAQGRIGCTSCVSTGSITESCRSCGGHGRNDCSSCTNGRITCNHCNGQGGESCGLCGGRGTMGSIKDIPIPCVACGMSGRSTCSNCEGKKHLACRNCGGQGALRCQSCSGQGRVQTSCRSCNGQGSNVCRGCLGKKTIVERCRSCPDGRISVTCTRCKGDRVCPDCNGRGRSD